MLYFFRNNYWTPYRGIETHLFSVNHSCLSAIEPLIGGLRLWLFVSFLQYECYWTPYRGIDISLREWAISNEKVGIKCSFAFLRKGSGGGGVYGCGVWRVKSWVKNVLNTNKYIAISPIKWRWSSLTYLPLVVIIFEKSIILFYWTPYRGIDTLGLYPFFFNVPLLNPL